jgi:hypothetical protein
VNIRRRKEKDEMAWAFGFSRAGKEINGVYMNNLNQIGGWEHEKFFSKSS